MKRWLLLVLMLSMAALAAAFSLVNRDPVALDLLFVRLQLPLGVLVIAAVFTGAALAGMVLSSTVILAQNLKLRTVRRELDKLKSAQAPLRAAAVEPIAPNPPVV